MSRKLTYEFVKASFNRDNYTLVSDDYVNAKTKLKYVCPNGHTHTITWSDWKQGKRCPYCDGQGKPTIDYVRKAFSLEGYILLSKVYTNAKTKLDYICPEGHISSINWDNWKQGKRCPRCASVKSSKLLAMDYSEVKYRFEKEGYVLLSTKYRNAHSKLDYTCPFGHIHSMNWSNWNDGRRCPTCRAIRLSGAGHPNWCGGKSFEKYCAVWKDQEYKQDIRERDGHKCLNPYCNSKNPNDLTIHHINYDKQDCHPNNLITVCRSCNSAANKDRTWHKAWYQAVMGNRYKEIAYV